MGELFASCFLIFNTILVKSVETNLFLLNLILISVRVDKVW